MIFTLLTSLAPIFLRTYLGFLEKKNTTEAAREVVRVRAEIVRRETRRDLIKSEQEHFLHRLTKLGFAIPVMLYQGKLLLWDKVMGWGTTDPLSVELAAYVIIVVGGYFLLPVLKRR